MSSDDTELTLEDDEDNDEKEISPEEFDVVAKSSIEEQAIKLINMEK